MDDEDAAELPVHGGLNSAQMTMVQLLAVLRGYLRCLPETYAEARFEISRLVPQACSVSHYLPFEGEFLDRHAAVPFFLPSRMIPFLSHATHFLMHLL